VCVWATEEGASSGLRLLSAWMKEVITGTSTAAEPSDSPALPPAHAAVRVHTHIHTYAECT
jgi:hypothetical protein